MVSIVATPPTYEGLSNSSKKLECPPEGFKYFPNESDTMATAAHLPNGVHAVFTSGLLSRGAQGQKTHTATCISFITSLKGTSIVSEGNINKIIQKGGIGCLHIVDNKISSLTLRPDMIENLKGIGVEEFMLKINDQKILAIDHPVPIKTPKSDEQYEKFCSQIVPLLKKNGVIT